MRLIVAGGFVVVIYMITTTVLADLVGLPFQVALAIGFATGLMVQFTVYRGFVWPHHEGFVLPAHHQAGRYLAAAAIGYGLTAAATSLLPGVLGVSTEIVLGTVVALPGVNFMVSRHKRAPDEPTPMAVGKGLDS